LIELADKEIHRTHWDRAFRELAWMYHHRLSLARETWRFYSGNLITAFKQFQDEGRLEIITTAATHGLLPLLSGHPPSVRAQILTARDHYRSCFGRDPRGIWLPECAYTGNVESYLQEANIRWFILDTHGLLHANPGRAMAPLPRSSRRTAWRCSGVTSIPPARCGASTKAIPATRATAISTATSALTSISNTSNRICLRRRTAGSRA